MFRERTKPEHGIGQANDTKIRMIGKAAARAIAAQYRRETRKTQEEAAPRRRAPEDKKQQRRTNICSIICRGPTLATQTADAQVGNVHCLVTACGCPGGQYSHAVNGKNLSRRARVNPC
jgi:hypothetical protein